PVVLRSAELKVTLDGNDSLPYSYELSSGARIRGEDFGRRVSATICHRSAWMFPTLDVLPSSRTISPTRADFLFEVKQESQTAVRFTIRYELNEATLHTTLEDVQESPGFELIDVALPCLATVHEEDGQAWLAHGDDGGSLVMLREAKAGELPPNTFWGAV